MRTFWTSLLLVGCASEPDWVAGCAADCGKGQICTVAAAERCVDPPEECAEMDACGSPSDACIEAICGQSSTWSHECWQDDETPIRNIVYCDASGI